MIEWVLYIAIIVSILLVFVLSGRKDKDTEDIESKQFKMYVYTKDEIHGALDWFIVHTLDNDPLIITESNKILINKRAGMCNKCFKHLDGVKLIYNYIIDGYNALCADINLEYAHVEDGCLLGYLDCTNMDNMSELKEVTVVIEDSTGRVYNETFEVDKLYKKSDRIIPLWVIEYHPSYRGSTERYTISTNRELLKHIS